MYHHFVIVASILAALRPAFTNVTAFKWFRTYVLGLICRRDDRGVTSIVRSLRLEERAYHSLIHMFRSQAWSARSLRAAWCAFLARCGALLVYHGRYVLASDGCKVCKEGLRMPGVKRIVQESGTSSKPQTMMGHMFGAVGVMAGTLRRCLCVPMKVNLQDGMRAAAGWDGAGDAGISPESHVVQSVRSAFECARVLRRRCLLAMDRTEIVLRPSLIPHAVAQ